MPGGKGSGLYGAATLPAGLSGADELGLANPDLGRSRLLDEAAAGAE